MSTVYFLIGVPGSGKSTWVKTQQWTNDCRYISSDHYIEEYAKRVGKTYNEVFSEFIPHATKMMNDEVADAVASGDDVIWDQTNITSKTRINKLKHFLNYYKVAVVFTTPDEEEHKRRLNRPGKSIPTHVLDQMKSNLEMPTEAEGFDKIIVVP